MLREMWLFLSQSNTFSDLMFFSNAICFKISLIVLFANYSRIKTHKNDLMYILIIALLGSWYVFSCFYTWNNVDKNFMKKKTYLIPCDIPLMLTCVPTDLPHQNPHNPYKLEFMNLVFLVRRALKWQACLASRHQLIMSKVRTDVSQMGQPAWALQSEADTGTSQMTIIELLHGPLQHKDKWRL